MSISLQNLQGNYSSTQIQGTWNATTRPTEGAMNTGNTLDLNSLFQNLLQSLLAILQGLQGDDSQTQPNEKPEGQQGAIPEVNYTEFDFNSPTRDLNANNLRDSDINVDTGLLYSPENTGLFGEHVISNQQQLEDFADSIGVSVDDLPSVDFENRLLAYSTRDAGDPNIYVTNAALDQDGTASLFRDRLTSIDSYQTSDQTNFDFTSFDREGVEEFVGSTPRPL